MKFSTNQDDKYLLFVFNQMTFQTCSKFSLRTWYYTALIFILLFCVFHLFFMHLRIIFLHTHTTYQLQLLSLSNYKPIFPYIQRQFNIIRIIIKQRMTEVDIDVDSIIKKLIQVKGSKPGKQVKLSEEQIVGLIRIVKEIFMSQPMLLEITAPVKICGDIHGQYYDMLRLLEYGGFPPGSSYLFLGDYVDRGRQSIETVTLLFALKIKYPKHIHILRGNHQSAAITKIYGFYQQCKKRYNIKMWKNFIDCFNCLPVAALIDEKILCMHGGLSPDLINYSQINSILRPTDIPETGILCDLLWSDPEGSVKMWGQSQRGVSYVFGNQVVTTFLKKNNLDLICRAHQVVEDGYEFFGKKQLVTIFSAPNYCNQFNNSGAMMKIQEDLTCSFQVLRPHEKVGPFKNTRPHTPIKRGGS